MNFSFWTVVGWTVVGICWKTTSPNLKNKLKKEKRNQKIYAKSSRKQIENQIKSMFSKNFGKTEKMKIMELKSPR